MAKKTYKGIGKPSPWGFIEVGEKEVVGGGGLSFPSGTGLNAIGVVPKIADQVFKGVGSFGANQQIGNSRFGAKVDVPILNDYASGKRLPYSPIPSLTGEWNKKFGNFDIKAKAEAPLVNQGKDFISTLKPNLNVKYNIPLKEKYSGKLLKNGGDMSVMGYRDDSQYRNEDFIDIDTQGTGLIDMSNTGIPLMANGQLLQPYSGEHKVPIGKDGIVREKPAIMQYGTGTGVGDNPEGAPAKVPSKLDNLSEGTLGFWNELSTKFGMTVDDITSAYRGPESGVGKNPGKSRHAHGEALDLNPKYTNVYNWLQNTQEGLTMLTKYGMGVIDETDPETKLKTGATGDHFHIGTDSHYAKAAVTRLADFDNLEELKSYKELHSGHTKQFQELPESMQSKITKLPQETQYDVLESIYNKTATVDKKLDTQLDKHVKAQTMPATDTPQQEHNVQIEEKNQYIDKINTDMGAPKQRPTFGQGKLFKVNGGPLEPPVQDRSLINAGANSIAGLNPIMGVNPVGQPAAIPGMSMPFTPYEEMSREQLSEMAVPIEDFAPARYGGAQYHQNGGGFARGAGKVMSGIAGFLPPGLNAAAGGIGAGLQTVGTGADFGDIAKDVALGAGSNALGPLGGAALGMAGQFFQNGDPNGMQVDPNGTPANIPPAQKPFDLEGGYSMEDFKTLSPQEQYLVNQNNYELGENGYRNEDIFDYKFSPAELKSYIDNSLESDPDAFAQTGVPTEQWVNKAEWKGIGADYLGGAVQPPGGYYNKYTQPVKPTGPNANTRPTPASVPLKPVQAASIPGIKSAIGTPMEGRGTFEGQDTDYQYKQYLEQQANDPAMIQAKADKATQLEENKAHISLLGESAEGQQILAAAREANMTPSAYLESQEQPVTAGVTFQAGGGMNNGGFGLNTMNELPVTQFGAGGKHKDNPNGGIPQGTNPDGQVNLVEEGELKFPDPRDPSGENKFIVSADKKMKFTKDLVEKNDLPKKYIGMTVLDVANKILRKNSGREGDTIEENTIKLDLLPFVNAHAELSDIMNAKAEEAFNADMAKLTAKHPGMMDQMGAPQGMPQGQPGAMPQMPPQMPGQAPMQMGGQMFQYANSNGMQVAGPLNNNDAQWDAYNQGNPALAFGQQNIAPYLDNANYIEGQNTTDKAAFSDFVATNAIADYKRDKANNSKVTGGLDTNFGAVNQPHGSQTKGNAIAQMLPLATNIGMGLFGKEDSLKLDRVNPQKLDRVSADQQLKEAGYAEAGLRKDINASAGQGGSRMAMLQRANVMGQQQRAGIHESVNNANSAIGNQEATLAMQADNINLAQERAEQMYGKQAKAAKTGQLMTGIGQVAGLARANQLDDMGMDYNSMYSEDFQYQYDRPFKRKN